MWTVAKIRADYEGWWLFEDYQRRLLNNPSFLHMKTC